MQAWEQFLKQQETELGIETVHRWLRPLKLVRFDAANLYLQAGDSFQALWFEEHIRPKLNTFLNHSQKRIKIHLSIVGEKTRLHKKPSKSKKMLSIQEGESFVLSFEEIDPALSFDQFIVSEENLLPFKILQQVCDRFVAMRVNSMSLFKHDTNPCLPEDAFNPIYVYGPQGVGKTHLLMATAQRLKKTGYHVIYTRSEQFADHVVGAIRSGEMTRFREIYRKADVFIIDDVHLLARKGATQEEFFHTFNTLHTAGKQIILSSHTMPQNLSHIEPRIISRFEWGITVPMSPLSKKDVIQVLEKKASQLHYPLNPRVADLLVNTFINPKSLVKALNALVLRTHLKQPSNTAKALTLSPQELKKMLVDLIDQEKMHALNPHKIMQAVAEFYGIRTEDVTGKSQSRECVIPRQIAMYLCRQQLKLPYMKIGDLFTRDHSTVMASIKQVEKKISQPENDFSHALSVIQLKIVPHS